MAQTPLTLTLEGADGAAACLASLSEVAEAFLEAGGGSVDLPLSLVEAFDLHAGRFAACRTIDNRLLLEPGDGCRELVTAMRALEFDGRAVKVDERHGWPILSVVQNITTVTEDRGAGNCSPAEA